MSRCFINVLAALLTVAFAQAGYSNKCPDGYVELYDNFCLKYLNNLMAFWDAITACRYFGGELLKVRSKSEMELVNKYIAESKNDMWVGSIDIDHNSYFKHKVDKRLIYKNCGGRCYQSDGKSPSRDELDNIFPPARCPFISTSRHQIKWVKDYCGFQNAALCQVRLDV